MSFKDYDIKKLDKWIAPTIKDDQVKILSAPNIPRPLHGQAPRTIFGDSTWNHMRKRCYFEAGYKCCVCGDEPAKGKLHAHELYDIDYTKFTSTFKRCVALCSTDHTDPGVHTGRALTLYKRSSAMMTRSHLLSGVEHIFELVHKYNTERKPEDEDDLRLYYVFATYAKERWLAEDMDRLIRKYDIKFWIESIPPEDNWSKWKLIVGTNKYPTRYTDYADWQKKMDAKNVGVTRKTEEEIAIDRDFEDIERMLAEQKAQATSEQEN